MDNLKRKVDRAYYTSILALIITVLSLIIDIFLL